MSSFLDDVQELFEETDFYSILNIAKSANTNEIRKAYYKLSLKVHPDRVANTELEQATKKFQVLGKIYEVLSNDEQRTLYDETGTVGNECNTSHDDRNWYEYWRLLFARVTTEDIEKFEETYKEFSSTFSSTFSRIAAYKCGPQTEKLRSRKWLCVRGTQHILESDDLREPVTIRQSLIKYSGACPGNDWKTKQAILKTIDQFFVEQAANCSPKRERQEKRSDRMRQTVPYNGGSNEERRITNGSNEELEDLKKAYLDAKGDMDQIIDNMMCATVEDDEARFRNIIIDWIKNKVVKSFKAFTSDSQEKQESRKRKASAEALEAERELKRMTKNGETSLAALIQRNQKSRADQADDFFADLEQKYGGSSRGSSKSSSRKGQSSQGASARSPHKKSTQKSSTKTKKSPNNSSSSMTEKSVKTSPQNSPTKPKKKAGQSSSSSSRKSTQQSPKKSLSTPKRKTSK